MKKIFLPLCLVLAVAVGAAPLKIELPIETASYKSGPGAELANAQCMTCHSADYAAMQPPKPRDFWKAEVEKMKGKYGAPLATNDMDGLIDYFAFNYGTVTNMVDSVLPFVAAPPNFISTTCAVVTAAGPAITFSPNGTLITNNAFMAPTPAMLNYGKELAIKNGCFNCHQINSKLIGPAYKEVAAKYKDNPEAMTKVAHQITQGGSGQWGPIPMPPFTQFTPDEVNALGGWILNLK